jgi:hypothetical protein
VIIKKTKQTDKKIKVLSVFNELIILLKNFFIIFFSKYHKFFFLIFHILKMHKKIIILQIKTGKTFIRLNRDSASKVSTI